MTPSSIVVRALATPAELVLHLVQADKAFSAEPSPGGVEHWLQSLISAPEYRPEEMRGAFRDAEQLGGYVLRERKLRIGEAQLSTGCIGAVVTLPAYRQQGVASALMQDAIDYALAHKHALLLLDGIPKFYYRYGYTDVFDLTTQDIHRAALLAQPLSEYHVRPATVDDAASVLALYERQYGSYTGSFVRTLAWQRHWLQYRSLQNPLLLAIDPSGQPQGYLALARDEVYPQSMEMAADNWLATLALLQHHARLLGEADAPQVLRYRLPSTAPLLWWIIDNLEVPDVSAWKHPPEEWGIRSQSYHHRYAGWMARLVHLPTLAQQMLPEWQARWRRSLAHWSGDITLIVAEETCTLHIDGTALQLVNGVRESACTLHLSSQMFMALLFGYRPLSWVVEQDRLSLSAEQSSVLNILFSYGNTWIPSSDAF